MLPDRLAAYRAALLGDLLAILLRQFRRPLAGQGIDLSDAEAEAIAHDIAERRAAADQIRALREALAALVEESRGVLAGWNLTFQQSLDTEINDIPGWASTAEFLEVAGEKANAELRISTGGALLAALGDLRYAPDLLFLVERGEDDLDAVIARRVLLFAGGISDDNPDWREKLRTWIEKDSTHRRED